VQQGLWNRIAGENQRMALEAVDFDVAIDNPAQRGTHRDVGGDPSWEDPHHPVVK
jgi:hypothetical protein